MTTSDYDDGGNHRPFQPENAPGSPERVRGLNFFTSDRNLERFLSRVAPDMLYRQADVLTALGAFAGDRLDRQAERSDQSFPPALADLPDNGHAPTHRVNELRLNPEYEACQQELYRSGLVARCFEAQAPESPLLPFTAQYLVSQADITTGCPFAMTHPVALVIDRLAPAAVRDRFLSEIIRTDGKTAIGGTWATERHSGSDVGASTTVAHRQDDGTYRLEGHNWFTSAFGFAKVLAIKTARPVGAPPGSKGLGLYLVPSHIDADWQVGNNLAVTHLKRKLGTRGLPTVEVALEGAHAHEIAPAGQGLKAMMTALGCSRVHNAMAAAGVMRRAYLEALCWAEHRQTFGQPLLTRPMVQKRLLAMAVRWQAGCALAFEAARRFDAGADPQEAGWMRIATALAKFWTGEQAVWCAQKALELVGGNGYTEDYPTARLFRDAMVLPVWEGPEQIQALELIRMVAGQASGDRLFLDRLAGIEEGLPAAMTTEKTRLEALHDKMGEAFATLRADPAKSEFVADDFLHSMADALSYALLCEEAAWELTHHDDQTKWLMADHYYRTVLVRESAPSFAPTRLQEHVGDVLAGRAIGSNHRRDRVGSNGRSAPA